MSRKAALQRSPELKLQIVMEGLRSGNIAETCRKHEIAANLYYRWKDEVEKGALEALGGKRGVADSEKDQRIRQLERTLGRKSLEIEILKNVLGD